MTELGPYLYYGLDGQPITRDQWSVLWGDREARRIAFTEIGDVEVSTVWLGLDHRFLGEGPPLIFETMVFGGEFDGYVERYATRDAALAGHDQALAAVNDPARD